MRIKGSRSGLRELKLESSREVIRICSALDPKVPRDLYTHNLLVGLGLDGFKDTTPDAAAKLSPSLWEKLQISILPEPVAREEAGQ